MCVSSSYAFLSLEDQYIEILFEIFCQFLVLSETSVEDPGCLSQLPDLDLSIADHRCWIWIFHLGSADPQHSLTKSESIFPKKLLVSSRIYDPRCLSRSCISDPGFGFFCISYSGSGSRIKGPKSTGSRIRMATRPETFKYL